MLEEFLEWFEGNFNNWSQASSWPSYYSHVLLTHERLDGTKFLSRQRYKHNGEEYRRKEIEIIEIKPLKIFLFLNYKEIFNKEQLEQKLLISFQIYQLVLKKHIKKLKNLI